MEEDLLKLAHAFTRKQQYYLQNSFRIKQNIYHRRFQLQKTLYTHKIGHKCSKCSSQCSKKDVKDYVFHHKNPKNKLFEISDAVSWGYSWKRIEKELKKTVFLCAECHLLTY